MYLTSFFFRDLMILSYGKAEYYEEESEESEGGSGEMAWWLRLLTSLANEPNANPCTMLRS